MATLTDTDLDLLRAMGANVPPTLRESMKEYYVDTSDYDPDFARLYFAGFGQEWLESYENHLAFRTPVGAWAFVRDEIFEATGVKPAICLSEVDPEQLQTQTRLARPEPQEGPEATISSQEEDIPWWEQEDGDE